jgi:hypothetical protein
MFSSEPFGRELSTDESEEESSLKGLISLNPNLVIFSI